MLVAGLLLNILNDMLKEEFETFKFYLKLDILEKCDPIPRYQLEDKSRTEVVEKLLKTYGEETAVKVTAKVLENMSMNEALQKLRKFKPAAEITQSSSSIPPSAGAPPAVMTAQEGSVIIAPTIMGGGTTSCNITISK